MDRQNGWIYWHICRYQVLRCTAVLLLNQHPRAQLFRRFSISARMIQKEKLKDSAIHYTYEKVSELSTIINTLYFIVNSSIPAERDHAWNL